MLTLYERPTCPYCHKVFRAADSLGLALNKLDIGDPAVAAELIQRGGKRQVPYLVDNERGVEMYESEDIVKYLMQNYPHS